MVLGLAIGTVAMLGNLGFLAGTFVTRRLGARIGIGPRSEEHTSELQSRENLVCRLLLDKKKTQHGQCHDAMERTYTASQHRHCAHQPRAIAFAALLQSTSAIVVEKVSFFF